MNLGLLRASPYRHTSIVLIFGILCIPLFGTSVNFNRLCSENQTQCKGYRWKKLELQKLAKAIRGTLNRLQNPVKCDTAKKLVCQLNKGCGFGCQMHHVTYCFITALALNRTVILDDEHWSYVCNQNDADKHASWTRVFLPLSNTCLNDSGRTHSSWDEQVDHVQVIHLPWIDFIEPQPSFLPRAIPKQLSARLQAVHGFPFVWFVGQILSYIMQPAPVMQHYMRSTKRRLKFTNPIVGVHIRRTDKIGTEATFHSLSEYMVYVEGFFNQTDFNRQPKNKATEKRVYIATDDPEVWHSEVNTYKLLGYRFIGDVNIAKSASKYRNFPLSSLKDVILDVWLLSQCDYLVCTFSSQICRLAYELMQSRGVDDKDMSRIDWSTAYTSIDDPYYFGGQIDHEPVAVVKNTRRKAFHMPAVAGIDDRDDPAYRGPTKKMQMKIQQAKLDEIYEANFKAFEDLIL